MNELAITTSKQNELTAKLIKDGGVLFHKLAKIGDDFASSLLIAATSNGYRIGFKHYKSGKIIKQERVATLAEVKKIAFAVNSNVNHNATLSERKKAFLELFGVGDTTVFPYSCVNYYRKAFPFIYDCIVNYKKS